MRKAKGAQTYVKSQQAKAKIQLGDFRLFYGLASIVRRLEDCEICVFFDQKMLSQVSSGFLLLPFDFLPLPLPT
jgi:hypothetical protein